MGRIWRNFSGDEPKVPADLVLESCGGDGIHCWDSTSGALEMAMFLQPHLENGQQLPAGRARVRFAYRSFHPEPVEFTRRLTCSGGTLAPHEEEKMFTLMSGRLAGKRHRTAFVPDAVEVTRGSAGVQVDAHVTFASPRLQLDNDGHEPFSVDFPEGQGFDCCCCS